MSAIVEKNAPPVQQTEPEKAPATPPAPLPFVPMPAWKASLYVASSLILGLTQGLGMNLVTANLSGLQASFDATQTEMTWLAAAYVATNMTGTILMFKVRGQFGLRRFAEIGLLVYAAIAIAHLFTNDLQSAIVLRAVLGVAAAPLSTLAFFYMLEWLPPQKKMSIGICFGMLGSSMSLPLARVISPDLLQIGSWHGLYLLEVGMALICVAIAFLLPLSHPPRIKMFDRDDLISFPLLSIGFAALAVVLTTGRAYWWFEAPWLGVVLAVGIASLVLFCLVELHRKSPIVDLRWWFSRDMMLFAACLLAFRVLLSEQTVGAVGLFTVLGLQNDQLIPLFGMIGIVTFATTAWLSQVIKPDRTHLLHLVALLALAVGAWLDAQSTVLSRPEQFYISQALVGFSAALFMPPAMLNGFMSAFARGPQYILSFLTVFIATQTFGGVLGSALFTTLQALREQFHSNVLGQGITLLDPMVVQRVQAYGGVYSHVLTDPAQSQARGIALLAQQTTLQANVLAYNDVFLVIFYLTLAAIAALLANMLITALRHPAAVAQPA
nr:MFS transporter [uncultured Devosia sp.]